LSLPFDPDKQHRIGAATAALGLLLAVAGYSQRHRKRTMTHAALAVAILALVTYVFLVPL
jgi:hypothetical protein